MHQLPSGWKIFSQTENSLTAVLPGHTVAAPRIAIFDRRVATQNGNGFSVPTYRVRLISGDLDPENMPIRERVLVDCTIRVPVNANSSLATASLAALAGMLADPEFVDDATVDQMFPREATE